MRIHRCGHGDEHDVDDNIRRTKAQQCQDNRAVQKNTRPRGSSLGCRYARFRARDRDAFVRHWNSCPEGDWGSTWTERLARIGRLPPKPNAGYRSNLSLRSTTHDFSGLTEIYSCLSPAIREKCPAPLVRRTMSQSSNAKTADNSVIAAAIWSSTRCWPPPEQRAVFQPSGVAVFAITAA